MARREFIAVGALLLACLLAGGGGRHAPLQTALLAAAAAPLLAWSVFRELTADRRLPALAAVPLVLLALAMLLVVAQTLPLPPTLIRSLPGREALMQAAGLTDDLARWRPISLFPEATRAAAVALLPPAALFVAIARTGYEGRLWLCWVVIAAAIASTLLGAVQLSLGGDSAAYLYKVAVDRMPSGLFANRNHQATLLACGLLFTCIELRDALGRENVQRSLILGGVLVFLAIGALSTLARAAPFLVALAILLGMLVDGVPRPTARRRGVRGWLLIGLPLGAGVLLLAAALLQSVLPRVAKRFMEGGGSRLEIWSDTLYAIGQYFPVGSGIGTFSRVFRAVERLDALTPATVANAHNDYLELILEGGLPAGLLLAVFLLWLAAMAWRVWRRDHEPRLDRGARMATIGLLIILGHSLFDYPLRTEAVTAVAALCLALLTMRNPSPDADPH